LIRVPKKKTEKKILKPHLLLTDGNRATSVKKKKTREN